jgi:glycosyltransferase involved in cell wall biosynthesis
LKILHVIPYFYPAWRFGGPVKVAYDVTRKLAERGHSVVVYTSDVLGGNSRVNTDYAKVDGVNVFYFSNLSLYAANRKVFVTPSLISAIKDNAKFFDIVHVHGNRTTQNPILHYFLMKNKVPYVVQAHGGLPNISGHATKRMYDLLFGYKMLRDASKVIALTQKEARQYRCMGVSMEKIEVVPNGIDISEYSKMPPKGSFKKKFSISEEEKIILYIGRVHQSKGLNSLVEAFSIVVKELKNTRFVVVGPNDGYATTFSNLVSTFGLKDNVLLTGFLEKKDKLAALRDSDVFVTTSFYGFPMTFLEACVAGCPIVTGTDELNWVHDNVGLVTENSPSMLARAILRILNDDATRERFRKNCKLTIRDFCISKVVSQLEKVYEAALLQNSNQASINSDLNCGLLESQ